MHTKRPREIDTRSTLGEEQQRTCVPSLRRSERSPLHISPMSASKELEELRAQYGVTVKVVKAQGEYISDLESKNLALTKHIKEGKSEEGENADYLRRLDDLKRGVEYYKAQAEEAKKESEDLKARISIAEAEATYQNNGSDPLNTSETNVHRQQERLTQLERVHMDSAQSWAAEKASLKSLVEKHQQMTLDLQKALEKERKEKDMKIEAQVSARVQTITSTARTGAETVELASLRVECDRLRSVLGEREAGVADTTDMLAEEVTKLRDTLHQERLNASGRIHKMEDHLKQTRKLFQEREMVIAEERKAFEDELDLVKATSKKKESALRKQNKDLANQLESLTNHLASRGASDDPTEREEIAQVKEEYEKRLRNVLKMREESESRTLQEKKDLIEEFKRMEVLRDQREQQTAKEMQAKFDEADAMLQAWEQRDSSLKADARNASQRVESVSRIAQERDATLLEEIENVRKANARIMALTEGREKANAMEVEALQAEMIRLQTAYNSRELGLNDLRKIHEDEMMELDKLVRLAEGRVEDGPGEQTVHRIEQERKSLMKELDEARQANLGREVVLSEMAETRGKAEIELRRSLSEAVDALEAEQVNKQEAVSQAMDEIAALRKHLDGANAAHSRSESAAANEIRRLMEENGKLKSKLKEQRQQFEKGIHQQEKIVRCQIDELTNETNTLRDLMEKLHRNFRIYRENAERERARLVNEIEKVDAEKISIFELMRKKEEVHKVTNSELEGRAEMQRQEIEELEVENASIRDQLHTDSDMSLPGMWQARQQEMTEAFSRTSDELSMLRERLFDQEEERRAEVKPLLVEIKMLRDAQKKHECDLAERDALWKEERERLRTETDTILERVQKSEAVFNVKTEALVEEIKSISTAKARVVQLEVDRKDFVEQERASLLKQRESMESNYRAKTDAVDGHRVGLEDELNRLRDAVTMQKDLMEASKQAIDAQYKEELVLASMRAATAEQMLATCQEQMGKQKSLAFETERLMTEELKELRDELHHLRQATTEKHLELSKEKALLIGEIERLAQAPGDQTSVAATFKQQMASSEEASYVREQAFVAQIEALEESLSRQRRLNEERAVQHEAELRSFKEIAMNKAASGPSSAAVVDSEASTTAAIFALREQIRQVRSQAEREKNDVQMQMQEMQRSMGRREDHLKQQILSLQSRNDIMSTQLERSLQDMGKHGNSADQMVREARTKSGIEIKSLREQNQLLSRQVVEMQEEMEERERVYRQKHDQIMKSFRQFKASRGGASEALA